jgi:circadian clock protein KaiB
MNKYVLRLYVSGRTSRSERAVDTLRRICEQQLSGRCDMTIIDVLERPQLAEDERILATPTLVRYSPPPARRIIGDLSDLSQVLLGLDLAPDGGMNASKATASE